MIDTDTRGLRCIATELTDSGADPNLLDAVTTLADQVANLTNRVDELEADNAELRDELDEHRQYSAKQRADTNGRVTAVEEQQSDPTDPVVAPKHGSTRLH